MALSRTRATPNPLQVLIPPRSPCQENMKSRPYRVRCNTTISLQYKRIEYYKYYYPISASTRVRPSSTSISSAWRTLIKHNYERHNINFYFFLDTLLCDAKTSCVIVVYMFAYCAAGIPTHRSGINGIIIF